MTGGGAGERLLARVWRELERDPAELARVAPLPDVPLPARLDVPALAVASVAAASLAAWAPQASAGSIRLDGDRIAAAFQSERVMRFDGVAPDVWAPLSGFRRARDGWVRTHGNYPHHAAALRRVLGLSATEVADPAFVDAAVAQWSADELAHEVTAAGGMCIAVAPEDPEADRRLADGPLVEVSRLGDGAGRRRTRASRPVSALPLAGVRVLDLTRVIAGPVATRSLALLGADVLRVDPPSPPEIAWQHLDTGPGKRSALLDLRAADDAARFNALLGSADVVVLGYRPGALARLGLDPRELAAQHPGLVVAQLSAWGFGPEVADGGGFDSLVQAASGIAMVEGGPDAPGALPAQALDHATGYLLTAAVAALLARREVEGGSWLARMSLRRTAAELLTMPRHVETTPAGGLDDDARNACSTDLAGPAGVQRIPMPAIASPEGPMGWSAAPHAWGSDAPSWAE
ncbi:CoA transferase [Agromyces aurantiacus]|uniref:CoA transferase n=1 Tax=Agromyces aurantiacus TaxID=165814 RepID=A0ABV9R780_9MICO|nr:CoA transferase [Agromyces aurantiacus]MBM7504519.1 crotonobetainyl-CoA:carnitine CoA-transferase CaiB-like acyl-CoA transferase [Agromyces aurantiacus]